MSYQTLIVEPIREMMVGVVSFIPTLLTLAITLSILAIGWLIARVVTKFIVHVCRTIKFDLGADKIGLTKVLKKGGVKQKPSNLVGCIAYWVIMVMVLITTIKYSGIAAAGDFLDGLFAYIPHVVIGSLVLIVGMLLARVISALIYVTAKNTDMPIPETLRDLSKTVIVAYVTIMYLKEVGFVSLFAGASHTIFMAGIVFALALAFGLAGKDVASKYLEVLKK